MDFLLDILQGAGLAAAIGIRPFLPVLLAGALAPADLGIDFEGTEFAFLGSGRSCSACSSLVAGARLVGRRAGATPRRPPLSYALLGIALVLGALSPPARSPTSSALVGRALGRLACARCSASAARSLFSAGAPAARRRGRGARCRSTRRAPRSLAAGVRSSSRRSR